MSLVCLMLPNSRGSVSLSSTDARDNPVINPEYLNSEVDRAIIRHAVRYMLKVFATPQGSSIVVAETPPLGFEPLSAKSIDDEIDARIRADAFSFWHAAGTLAMGKVVDSELRVKGVDCLRVVDASVLPVPIAAHYQSVVYALAEQAADIMSEKRPAK